MGLREACRSQQTRKNGSYQQGRKTADVRHQVDVRRWRKMLRIIAPDRDVQRPRPSRRIRVWTPGRRADALWFVDAVSPTGGKARTKRD
jgi:hypothetical protein